MAMGLLQCGPPLGWLIAALLAAPLLQISDWRNVCFIAFLVFPLLIPIGYVLRKHGQLLARSQGSRL
ncbi:MAG: MFS family permease [Halieaceae bacterium]|jgi:MFS family permease